MRKWEMGNPLYVLMRRGQDCTHCQHLGKWRIADQLIEQCDNASAPEKKRKEAPASRCHLWRPHKEDSGV